MFITHFTAFAPAKSGMYESTKDQIKYERRAGLDSHLIDILRPDKESELKDDWLEPINWRKAMDADIWVVHQCIPAPLQNYLNADPKNRAKHKIVSILHGPVENMFLKEFFNLAKNQDEPAFTITHINAIWFWDACVVLNKHEYDISILYDEHDKLIHIQNSIDLERYPHDGWKWSYRNRPAIITADAIRFEKLTGHIIWAMPKVIEKIPDARLNMFGIPLDHVEFYRNLVCRAKKRYLDFNCIENYQMKFSDISPFIRGADIGFNNNYSGICARVHMEMQAMGIPVVSYNGDYTNYHAKIFDLQSIADTIVRCWEDLNSSDLRAKTIEYAYENYDRGKQVKEYLKLYTKLIGEK